MKRRLRLNTASVVVVLFATGLCCAAAPKETGEKEDKPKKIHTTCATDRQSGHITCLKLDSELMEWSTGPGKAGWIYCYVPHSKEKSARWEFAPSTATEIDQVDLTKLQAVKFYLNDTPQRAAAFGDCWKKGSSLLVTEGEVYFARKNNAPSVVYVLKIKKREKWRLWVDYAIADVPAKDDAKKAARWRVGVVKGEDDPKNILGTGLLLTPEQARTALVESLLPAKPVPGIVALRKGMATIGPFVCDLRRGTFYMEIIRKTSLEEKWGSFKREGKQWKAVVSGNRMLMSEEHYLPKPDPSEPDPFGPDPDPAFDPFGDKP